MKNIVVIAIFSVLSFEISSSAEVGDCYKVYLETRSYNQSQHCKDLFDRHLEQYKNGRDELVESDPDLHLRCIREKLVKHHVDQIFLRGLSKQKVNGEDEFSVEKDLKTIAKIFKLECNPKLAREQLDKITRSAEIMKPWMSREDEHLFRCMLKYLADRKFFNLDDLKSNSDMIAVQAMDNCEEQIKTFRSNYSEPDVSKIFGFELPNYGKCFMDYKKSVSYDEGDVAYSMVKLFIDLTNKQKKDHEKKGMKLYKSTHTAHLECFLNDFKLLISSDKTHETEH